ncbi:MAG: heparinase II/III family protein [Methyloceanibacter sp.]|uniref:heparinase II/III family protein n=1 Tax=Methyloceanibacter sp. TaxID=1965321 RepID=UPI001D4CF3E3|nr:heparinase II/III family protein [Methyloceanibacter sp.]MCB1443844.1 heparinase II/III family protein [Methyloceanibacter sp.]
MTGEQAFERNSGAQEVKLGGPGPLRRLMLSGMATISYPGSQAEQLLLAPQELRTADPSFATEIYNGHFGLAGKLAEIGARSPFEIDPPSASWARELYGFGWLRHLRAADSELAREQAKALVHDFIRLRGKIPPLAWQPEIVARRVISWLSNSVLILDASEPEAYEAFLKALTAQLRYLSAGYRDAPDGVPRLLSLMALLYGGLCIADQQPVVDRYTKPFCRELERQILPDGGHISRNPEALIELLLDLLPLRQCFVARDRTPPKELTDAVDRIMPMLRFFRLGDGSMARFNGAGPTPTDALATVRAYDDIDGAPVRSAVNSGYVRVEAGTTLILCDLGPPPAASLTRDAHAGFLSFEMSSGDAPIIINCGAPTPEFEEWRLYSRTTPAHSTLSLEDDSLAEFAVAREGAEPEPDAALIGPLNPQGAFSDQGEGGNLRIKGSHDGYVGRYGISHARQILIAPDGNLISSEEKLSTRGLRSPEGLIAGSYAVRFHLHPSVKAQLMGDGMSALLVLRNGETWRLSANAEEMRIEESVLLADPRGPQVTSQIVLSGMMGEARDVRIVWNLEKTGEETAPHPLVDPNDAPDTRSSET